LLDNMAVVNGRLIAVRKLSKAEIGVPKELVIHLLKAKVQGDLSMKGTVCISKEGPEELDPAVGKEESVLGVVCLEERSGGTKL